ncbi:hypothetical protein UlMin_026913 [Ulmus minor]
MDLGKHVTRYYWAIMLLHVVAILIFTKGFLLTRTELPYYSHCSDITQSTCLFTSSNSNANLNQTHHCWTKPAIGRLVIIVLDALRFDFVAPSTSFKVSKPWMNKLPVLQEQASQKPLSARIFKAIADPPTTSLQRLKGLTTGGLPTFIDVGNSFGAPAISEDNLIHQLVENGKRVVLMGDDTWTQLFPHHFHISYPYPSFNVKDLDTVDNGCIEHLFPSLYQEDWDVLIAHFLGVDHAGHIFGVDSIQMQEKLQQYNVVLEKVIETLENQSGPGGLHENTLLLVMGDHGQTVNGDHGGGSAEEVETSIFAMSFKKPLSSIWFENASSCQLDLENQSVLINSIQQLDFTATVSALLGIPFPFGSIGQVNHELYSLGAGTLNVEGYAESCDNQSHLAEWMQNYVNLLCINSWQVKRYVDVYSTSSAIGFSYEDLLRLENLYAQAAEKWSSTTRNLLLSRNESFNLVFPALKMQIDAYSTFLASVAELARSKWTEFNLKMMSIGFGIMLISIITHVLAIKKVKRQYEISFSSFMNNGISSVGLFVACSTVVIRAFSFLSNSYILEEGKVASFLLATSAIIRLRDSVVGEKKMLLEVVVFLLVVTVFRLTIDFGLSKQTPGSELLDTYPSWFLPVWYFITEILPILALILLAILLYKFIRIYSKGFWKFVTTGTCLTYMLIAIQWASESNILSLAWVHEALGKNTIPQVIYAVGFGQLLLLIFSRLFYKEKFFDSEENLVPKVMAMICACSSTIIFLSGKQGSLVSVAAIIAGYCIITMDNVKPNTKNKTGGNLTVDPLSITQWSLSAVCLFFCTGHWCAFDGLRYGAAFVGFDEFILVRQAILLTIDTFGFSLILPVFGIPFLVTFSQVEKRKHNVLSRLSLAYLLYGLITATTVMATIMCVTIHRRHLMVWGLFAPKFVFDVVGLLLTDVLICLASLYYFGQPNNTPKHK